MSIKKTETDIREDIKKLDNEIAIFINEFFKCKDRNEKFNIGILIGFIKGRIEYAKTLIDY